jgi:2-oxoglutarate dehydrogenase E2 component (dihydrolipoamide succinyltransferase)
VYVAPQPVDAPVQQTVITQPQQPPVQVEFPQPQPVYIAPQPPAEPVAKPQAAEPVYIAPPIIDAPKPSVEIIEMDRMRKLIAQHMVNSKQTSAHVTSFAEADVTNMVVWREKKKEDFEKRTGTKITFTPMFIECLVKVMKRYPIINSSVEGDKIAIKNYFNIGMATALPNNNLIVPVIKHAEQMGLVNLAKSVNALAANARNGKLKPDDTQGGTFTLTNVGSFGSLMGTPIINQPQVAILAVGAIKKRPVVVETDKGDFIGIRHMMYLSLSYDHRIIDGSVGASFLTEVAKEFENWNVNRELKLVVQEQYVD